MHLTRRHFIKATGSVFVAQTFLPVVFRAQAETSGPTSGALGQLIGASAGAARDIEAKYNVRNNLFFFYDMDNKIFRELEIPIGVAHDTHLHPIYKDQALIIEREGPYACLVDFKTMKVIRKISADPDHYFTGHGTYTPDGKSLYMPQYPRTRLDLSNIAVFDTKDYKITRRFDTGITAPHEFAWFPDNKRVAIGHYGLPSHYEPSNLRSGVVIYDSEKQSVIQEISPPDPNMYMCHVHVTKDEKIFILTHNSLSVRGEQSDKIRKLKADYDKFVVERPFYFDFTMRSSSIIMVDGKNQSSKPVLAVNHQDPNYKWGLSLAINEKHKVVGGTHGLGGVLSFQDASTGAFIKNYTFKKDEHPRGLAVTLNQDRFAVTSSAGHLHFFDAKTLDHISSETPKANRFNHMTHVRCVSV